MSRFPDHPDFDDLAAEAMRVAHDESPADQGHQWALKAGYFGAAYKRLLGDYRAALARLRALEGRGRQS
jgi:hypothetical protein